VWGKVPEGKKKGLWALLGPAKQNISGSRWRGVGGKGGGIMGAPLERGARGGLSPGKEVFDIGVFFCLGDSLFRSGGGGKAQGKKPGTVENRGEKKGEKFAGPFPQGYPTKLMGTNGRKKKKPVLNPWNGPRGAFERNKKGGETPKTTGEKPRGTPPNTGAPVGRWFCTRGRGRCFS